MFVYTCFTFVIHLSSTTDIFPQNMNKCIVDKIVKYFNKAWLLQLSVVFVDHPINTFNGRFRHQATLIALIMSHLYTTNNPQLVYTDFANSILMQVLILITFQVNLFAEDHLPTRVIPRFLIGLKVHRIQEIYIHIHF